MAQVYSEECRILQPHTANFPVFSPKEIQDIHERIAERQKENRFLKPLSQLFQRPLFDLVDVLLTCRKTLCDFHRAIPPIIDQKQDLTFFFCQVWSSRLSS